jgi:hypothetical protein
MAGIPTYGIDPLELGITHVRLTAGGASRIWPRPEAGTVWRVLYFTPADEAWRPGTYVAHVAGTAGAVWSLDVLGWTELEVLTYTENGRELPVGCAWCAVYPVASPAVAMAGRWPACGEHASSPEIRELVAGGAE